MGTGHLRLAALVACLAAAGGSAGFALAPEPLAQAAAPVEVRAGGVPVDLGRDPADEARRVARRYLAAPVDLDARERHVVRSRSALGVRVDTDRLAALLGQAADPRSPLRRLHARVRAGRALELPMPADVAPDAVTPELLAIKDALDRPDAPARMDTGSKALIAARPGRHLHVAETLDHLAEAARSGATHVAVRFDRDRDPRRGRDLAAVTMDAVLGELETRYNAANTAADRTHNLKVAAAKIDGLILMPGEEFDFNEVVGDRSEANGFRPAPQIEGGELVDGVGGGACQIAGTLHGAVFFAGLPIVERHPHSRPSTYIKMGLDAAVSYPRLDFRFRNDLPTPLVLEMRVDGGVARARVWGAARTRKVTFEREVTGVTPFDVREEDDEDLPEGIRVRVQRGVPGFEIHRHRRVEDVTDGRIVRDEENVDRYPPTTEIWHVGTGDPAPEGYEAPEGDRHPEYVADETLTMVSGPDTHGIEEHARAGRYGTYGWMEREGLVAADTAHATGE